MQYSTAVNQFSTIRSTLSTLVSGASGMLHVYDSYAALMDGAESPSCAVLLLSVDLSGIKETQQPTGEFDIIIRTIGNSETAALTTLGAVMNKLESYTVSGTAAGVEFSEVRLYHDNSGGVGAIIAVISMQIMVAV